MTPRHLTCPRCLHPVDLPGDADFCPRCGLGGLAAELAGGPRATITAGGLPIRIGRRLGVGDTCNVYECGIGDATSQRAAVFKIARDAAGDLAVTNAAAKLNRLKSGDAKLLPFLPTVVTTLQYRVEGDAVARQAAVLTYHDAIASPAPLYSLEEVQQHYRDGIDARDMAWMWRRLLTALLHLHAQGVVHGAITPAHVLIEPSEHKLVVIGWGAAALIAARLGAPPAAYRDWFDGEMLASPELDVKTAARTMLAVTAQHRPDTPRIDAALARYFDRCLAATRSTNAGQLLTDFDRLIETLWGPRRFRPFVLPPRSVAT